MKNVNNKGFLLTETVIVSVFVLSIFVLVYRNSVPIVGMYKNRARYDDVDSVYGINLFKELIENDGYLYKNLTDRVDSDGYIDITDCSVFKSIQDSYETCNNLKTALGVDDEKNKIYLSNWDFSSESSAKSLLSNDTLNRGLLEYVKYLNEQEETSSEYKYRLIFSRTVNYNYEVSNNDNVSVKQKSTVYYANIGL